MCFSGTIIMKKCDIVHITGLKKVHFIPCVQMLSKLVYQTHIQFKLTTGQECKCQYSVQALPGLRKTRLMQIQPYANCSIRLTIKFSRCK
jgi:hypothetical protein